MYVMYTIPALPFTCKAEEVDSPPFPVYDFWTSGFFSSSRLLVKVNVYVEHGEGNAGKVFGQQGTG